MKNIPLVRKVTSLLLALYLLQLTACTSPTAPFVNNNNKPSQDGTSDGGGGNGIDGKPYEAYIIDPTKQSAYLTHLAPIMEHLDKNLGGDSSNSPLDWKNFIKYKTWYLAPVEFNTISKDILGVSFSKDQTQQIAIQNNKEIWIDSRIYSKMSPEDQAMLLAHEYLMSLYFLKYKSFTQMCQTFEAVSHKNLNCSTYEPLDELYPSKTPQPLNTDDYHNIRRAVGFVWQSGMTATMDEVRKTLLENNFDRRLFTDHVGPAPKKPIEIPVSAIEQMLKYSDVTNQPIENCQFIGLNKTSKCKLQFSKELRKPTGSDYTLPYYVFKLSNQDDTIIYEEAMMATGSLWATFSYDITTGTEFYIIPLSAQKIIDPKIGDRFRNNYIFAIQNPNSKELELRINGIFSFSGVITNVRESNGRYQCFADQVRPQIDNQDNIISYFDQTLIYYIKFIMKHLLIYAPCY